MPTPAERQALLFIAAVAALGIGVRACRSAKETPVASSREALATQLAAVDSAIAADGARKPRRGPRTPRGSERAKGGARISAATPAAPTPAAPTPAAPTRDHPLDLDVADSAALEALPGIGPALAARIVADRRERGPFGSLEALQQVKGIGPAMAARLAPLVTFSSPPRQPRMGSAGARSASRP